jgi:hypothetical protein
LMASATASLTAVPSALIMPTMSNSTFKLRIGTEMAEGSAASRN